MSTAQLLPDRIDLITDVPMREQGLYGVSHDGYRLTPGGAQLAAYRKMVAENYPGYEPPPPPKIVKMQRADWAHLLSAARADEKAWFLKHCANRRIKVEV